MPFERYRKYDLDLIHFLTEFSVKMNRVKVRLFSARFVLILFLHFQPLCYGVLIPPVHFLIMHQFNLAREKVLGNCNSRSQLRR